MNEALTQLIWLKCPKSTFVLRFTLEVGCASAVINYKDGVTRILQVFQKLNLPSVYCCKQFGWQSDEIGIVDQGIKTTSIVKQRCKRLRAIAKHYIDKNEGSTYNSGTF